MIKLLAFTMLLSTSAVAKRWLPIHSLPHDNKVIQIFPQEEVTQQDSQNFNITVWNMYKGKNKSWESDFEKLLKESSFFITQEVYLKPNMRKVFSSLPKYEAITATSFLWKGETETGVATISNTAALDYKYLRSKGREPIVRTPKVSLLSTYKLTNGEDLLIANIHAVNMVSSRKLKRQLKNILKEIDLHEGPVIFAGDFNTWSKKKTKMLKRLMKASSLLEVPFKKSEDHRMTFNKKVLDYIFYKGLKLNHATVRGDIQGADHKPMTANFSFLN